MVVSLFLPFVMGACKPLGMVVLVHVGQTPTTIEIGRHWG
jgi:hypothetical protein